MQSDLPKVLQTLSGRPLILHVIDSIKSSGISDIIVVVGYEGERVVDVVGSRARIAWQKEQLGTGHAVMQTEQMLAGFSGNVLVGCGDVPLIRPESFSSMVDAMNGEKVKAVVLTMKVDNPDGYGRIIKNSSGDFVRIVEHKDAGKSERKIREVNTGTYVFEGEFLFSCLKGINTENAQGEYYLPDVLHGIVRRGYRVMTLQLENPLEGSGINTREDLQALEKYLGGTQ